MKGLAWLHAISRSVFTRFFGVVVRRVTSRLFTVPYFFVRSSRYSASYHLWRTSSFMCRGGGRRGFIALGGGGENTRQQFSLSFSELRNNDFEFNSWQIRQHLRNWTRRYGVMKFERARLHFISKVSPAVEVAPHVHLQVHVNAAHGHRPLWNL